jgi:outer membrane phospholipase A
MKMPHFRFALRLDKRWLSASLAPVKGITTLRLPVRFGRYECFWCVIVLLLFLPLARLAAAEPGAGATAAAATNAPHRSAVSKFFDNRLSPYEPIYFVIGTHPSVKFQFSLKYQLIDTTNRLHALTNLFFAYTQTSFWDLISADPKFVDTSYKPSFFLYYHDIFDSEESRGIRLDLQPGVEHESNGRGGSLERSQNTAYLQPTLTFGKPGHLQFTFQPRAWFYFFTGTNNADVAQFRGYADLRTALTLKKSRHSWDNFQLATKVTIGDEWEHPGIEITGRYYIPHFTALQVTYFTGYNQYFLKYNKRSTGLRAGLCIWYWPDFAE